MPHNGYVAGSDKTQLQVIGRKEGLTSYNSMQTMTIYHQLSVHGVR